MKVTVYITPSDIYSTGAFDKMITGDQWRPARKIEAIKIVRQITGADLKTTVTAMRVREAQIVIN